MRCLEQLQLLKVSLFVTLVIWVGAFASQVDIYLKDIVFLNKSKVYIKDIAKVNAKNKQLAKYINSLYIGSFSQKGVVKKNQVLKLLKDNFLDTSQVKIHNNQTIVVVKKSTIDDSFIKNAVSNYLKHRYPNIYIENISVKKFSTEAVGKPKVLIKEKGKTSSYIYLTVLLPNLDKKVPVSVKYALAERVVVAKYPLPRGHTVKLSDVKLSKVKLKKHRQYIENLEEVVGKKLKRAVKKGQPITYEHLEKQYLVRKSSSVKVLYSKGSFKIEILGKALENGELGEVIKVRNISSGKVIQCKVIGLNQVQFLSGQF